MNGIGLSAQVYDLTGARYFSGREIHPIVAKQNVSTERRVSRQVTLDGGVSLYDSGCSDGDRTIALCIKSPTQADVDFLSYLTRTYSLLNVTTRDAAYSAAPQKCYESVDGLTLTLLVTEKIS